VLPNQIELYWHTARHLKPTQVHNRVLRRLPGRARVRQPALRTREGAWADPIWHEPTRLIRRCALQQYMLHYHERPDEELIRSWIEANPAGQGVGWDPYPLSRRIVNWIKWLLGGPAARPENLRSLASQTEWLARHVEYHLLGNHLFENAKALAFAGCFFESSEWLRKGLNLLEAEMAEQILPDGGHFERSPMYHSLILEDVLDLLNLRRAYPGLLPDWSPVAGRMLGWLNGMLHPDGQISFFNDSAFGVAPEPGLLFDYAARLGIQPIHAHPAASGYIRLENDATVVLFDAGPIGPGYQPGHAHADTLSFELSHRGQRLLVNSGISTYECGTERQWQRGTAAHNTVRVDGCDQSEVWSAFRVARRARPFDVRTDNRGWAEAAHDGYHRLKAPVTHRRRIELREENLAITDTLDGRGVHEIELFFHFYPGASADISLDPRLTRAVEETHFHPRFEQAIPNRTVAGRYRGACPVSFRTGIRLP
jgi:uncharacterized heparinase superfamily protein